MEEIEGNKVEKQKKQNKWKVNWFDKITFIYLGTFFSIVIFSPQLKRLEGYKIEANTINIPAIYIALSLVFSNIIFAINFIVFLCKNNDALRRNRLAIFIHRRTSLAAGIIIPLVIIFSVFIHIVLNKFVNYIF